MTYLRNADSRFMHEVLPELRGEVSLVVTSPPYHNAISYDSHAKDANDNYRPRQTVDYSTEYLSLLDEVWGSCFTMLRPGGYLAINVGTVLLDGYQFPLPQDLTYRLIHGSEPWEYVRTIYWHKVTAGVRRAGSVIKHALPGYWYPNIMTEHIIVVRKPGTSVKLNLDVPQEWWETIWDLAPVPPRSVPHPAPFPEDLPHRLIRMTTQPGDLVLDPFVGAGATSKAAADLDRVPVGFDLESKYLEYAQARLDDPSSVREMQLHVEPTRIEDFTPGPSRGKTRHGAGISARTKR
jgi:DNA modification methylase